jgi:catechol 2,3-dioxygenase-like lactoylglutathione lyase family enzyme
VNLRLDHIGVQVRDLAPAIELFSTLFGYTQATQPVVNTRHGVEVVFLEKPGSLPLKLFRSVGDPRPQPPRLHHLAFHVDDLAQAVETLSGQGARVLSPPAPGEAFDDEPIAFLFAGGLNIELISTERRRGRIGE